MSLWSLLAGTLGYLIREGFEYLKWRRVQRHAENLIADPSMTNDPQVAVDTAVLSIERRRISGITSKMPRVTNGSGPVKR